MFCLLGFVSNYISFYYLYNVYFFHSVDKSQKKYHYKRRKKPRLKRLFNQIFLKVGLRSVLWYLRSRGLLKLSYNKTIFIIIRNTIYTLLIVLNMTLSVKRAPHLISNVASGAFMNPYWCVMPPSFNADLSSVFCPH